MLALLSAERIGDAISESERRWTPGGATTKCLSITNERSAQHKMTINARVVATVNSLDEGSEDMLPAFRANRVSKCHNVHSNIIFLEFPCQFHHCILVRFNGRSGKYDDSLTLVLVFTMLQCKLCDIQSGRDVDRTADLQACSMYTSDDLTDFFCVRYEHFRP